MITLVNQKLNLLIKIFMRLEKNFINYVKLFKKKDLNLENFIEYFFINLLNLINIFRKLKIYFVSLNSSK